MQYKKFYSYDYDPGFEVNIDQLLQSNPGWSLMQSTSHFYIRTDSGAIQIKECGFRSGICLPEQMQKFVEEVKRYPKTPKTREETLRIVHVCHVFILQGCDDPFIMRPHVFDSMTVRANSIRCRLNNVSIKIRGPNPNNGRVHIRMQTNERTMPDFDENWRSYMRNVEKTLLAAIAAPDLLEENLDD